MHQHYSTLRFISCLYVIAVGGSIRCRCRAETAAAARLRCHATRAMLEQYEGRYIYRGAETPAPHYPTLSHMLIGYLRHIFLDATVHAHRVNAIAAAATLPTDKH